MKSFEDDDDGYISCPHCGETMLEAADYCPACDRWMTDDIRQSKKYSWWTIAVVLVLLATMILTIVGF